MHFSGGVNRIFLVGQVGQDIHEENIENTLTVCFSLITTETFQKNGRAYEHTEAHEVRMPVINKKNADIKPGDLVYVQGRLKTQQVLSNQMVKNYKTEIWVINIETLKSV